MTTVRLARYRQIYTTLTGNPADPTLWDPGIIEDATDAVFPVAAELLDTYADLARLVETDPTLDDADAAALAAEIRATWAHLDDEYTKHIEQEQAR